MMKKRKEIEQPQLKGELQGLYKNQTAIILSNSKCRMNWTVSNASATKQQIILP
ncbi:MAG: hypothetical protein U5L09_03870 [Bacteroidales bacterium]|nr:hypothetical protein [Bacteroidales bacterium]